MANKNKSYEGIDFRLKRCGYFGILWLCLIAALIGIVCFIELNLKAKATLGLTQDLETMIPIGYGVLAFFIATCWIFIVFNVIYILNVHKDDVNAIPILKFLVIGLFFLPFVFAFIALAIRNNYGVQKAKKATYPVNEAFMVNDKWYYMNEQGEFFVAIDNQWVKSKKPKEK